jgi:hypothetical protein
VKRIGWRGRSVPSRDWTSFLVRTAPSEFESAGVISQAHTLQNRRNHSENRQRNFQRRDWGSSKSQTLSAFRINRSIQRTGQQAICGNFIAAVVFSESLTQRSFQKSAIKVSPVEAVEAVCKSDEPPDALLSASVILRERAHAEAAVALREVHARQQVKGGLEAKGHVRQRSCASECTSLLSQLEGCLAKMGNCLTLRC